MNRQEKWFSLGAIGYLSGLVVLLGLVPAFRNGAILLPLALIGVALNAGLLFIVFKDILNRSFERPQSRLIWVVLVFCFMPAILIYLPLHGFRPRGLTQSDERRQPPPRS